MSLAGGFVPEPFHFQTTFESQSVNTTGTSPLDCAEAESVS